MYLHAGDAVKTVRKHSYCRLAVVNIILSLARTAALTGGSLDVKLSQHLDDKKKSIIDCREAIEEQQKLAEKLNEEIERAEKERQDILAEKQRIIDELTERVCA